MEGKTVYHKVISGWELQVSFKLGGLCFEHSVHQILCLYSSNLTKLPTNHWVFLTSSSRWWFQRGRDGSRGWGRWGGRWRGPVWGPEEEGETGEGTVAQRTGNIKRPAHSEQWGTINGSLFEVLTSSVDLCVRSRPVWLSRPLSSAVRDVVVLSSFLSVCLLSQSEQNAKKGEDLDADDEKIGEEDSHFMKLAKKLTAKTLQRKGPFDSRPHKKSGFFFLSSYNSFRKQVFWMFGSTSKSELLEVGSDGCEGVINTDF